MTMMQMEIAREIKAHIVNEIGYTNAYLILETYGITVVLGHDYFNTPKGQKVIDYIQNRANQARWGVPYDYIEPCARSTSISPRV